MSTSSPTILKTRFVIAVPNLQTSAAFYRDVLGFTIHPIPDPRLLIYAQGNCEILAGECPDAIPPGELGDHRFFAYLEVDDIASYHANVVARGADISKTLREEPWGMREFGVRTADGHLIMFGQPVE